MKKNQGITLIALIITIIVMLILVAVSVSVLVESDLIGAAEKAGNAYKTAYEQDGVGTITIGNKTYATLDDYFNNNPITGGEGPKLKYSVQGNVITVSLAYSYENYVASKSTPEKEQALAEFAGFDDIDALIEDWGCESREEFEADRMGFWGVSTYEEALYLECIDCDCLVEEYTTEYGDLLEKKIGGSYENYVASKSIPEKEQALAEAQGCDDIDALIEDWGYESREAFETGEMRYWQVSTYEEALNLDCIDVDCFIEEYRTECSDSYENYVASKSIPEKEQAFAEAGDFSDFNAFLEHFELSREEFETEEMSHWRVSTYEEALNLECMAGDCFIEEHITAREGGAKVTAPSGDIYYLNYMNEEYASFTYTVTGTGNYKFTAEDIEGRTSEINVPVELETFTLKYEDGTEIGSFEFVEGDTWEDFIGDRSRLEFDGGKKVFQLQISGVEFVNYNEYNLGSAYEVKKKVEENFVSVEPSEEIDAGETYYAILIIFT